MQQLEQIVLHLIDREYADVIDINLTIAEKVVLLAKEFSSRLTSLIAHWIRIGYCQGNFNSDNCAAGGFTIDYGPYGFCDVFHPYYQSWTGGGDHYSFLNQPMAAEQNFKMFCLALRPLLMSDKDSLQQLDEVENGFASVMQTQMENMWAAKLGLTNFNGELFNELLTLMMETTVDYTIFFRELSSVPEDIAPLKKSFYNSPAYEADQQNIDKRWAEWLEKWRSVITSSSANSSSTNSNDLHELSNKMKQVNPKYILREWFVVPAYQQAAMGDYSLVRQLQQVMTQPYAEQSKDIEDKYYRLKPSEFFQLGGTSHYSCSS
jgi:uncharacterized protein YdiU (UPF0061 family)